MAEHYQPSTKTWSREDTSAADAREAELTRAYNNASSYGSAAPPPPMATAPPPQGQVTSSISVKIFCQPCLNLSDASKVVRCYLFHVMDGSLLFHDIN